MPRRRKLRWGRVTKSLRRNFLPGLLIVVPLAGTVLIMKWLFNSIDGILAPAVEQIFGHDVPGIGFAAILILIYLTGVIATNVAGRRVIRYGESLLARVPGAREIYGTFKQAMESLMLPRSGAFKEVVLVEFPNPGMKAIGFVTNTMTDSSGQELVNVFIPTAPVPTSGFLELIPPDAVIRTGIPIDEAMKMIISGGIVSPKAIQLRGGQSGTT
jgi:uncharacterized membrane protein